MGRDEKEDHDGGEKMFQGFHSDFFLKVDTNNGTQATEWLLVGCEHPRGFFYVKFTVDGRQGVGKFES
jgi:hypothetical protein